MEKIKELSMEELFNKLGREGEGTERGVESVGSWFTLWNELQLPSTRVDGRTLLLRDLCWTRLLECSQGSELDDEFMCTKLLTMALEVVVAYRDNDNHCFAKERRQDVINRAVGLVEHVLCEIQLAGRPARTQCQRLYSQLLVEARMLPGYAVAKERDNWLDTQRLVCYGLKHIRKVRPTSARLEFLQWLRGYSTGPERVEVHCHLVDEYLLGGALQEAASLSEQLVASSEFSEDAILCCLKVQCVLGQVDKALLCRLTRPEALMTAADMLVSKFGVLSLDWFPPLPESVRVRLLLKDGKLDSAKKLQLARQLTTKDDNLAREFAALADPAKKRPDRLVFLQVALMAVDRLDGEVIKRRLFDVLIEDGQIVKAASLLPEEPDPKWTSRRLHLAILQNCDVGLCQGLLSQSEAMDSRAACDVVHIAQQHPPYVSILLGLLERLREHSQALVVALYLLVESGHQELVDNSIVQFVEDLLSVVSSRDDDLAKAVWNLALLCFNQRRVHAAKRTIYAFRDRVAMNAVEKDACHKLLIIMAAEFTEPDDAQLLSSGISCQAVAPTKRAAKCRPFMRAVQDGEWVEVLMISQMRLQFKLALPVDCSDGAILAPMTHMMLSDSQIDLDRLPALLDQLLEAAHEVDTLPYALSVVRQAMDVGLYPTNLDGLVRWVEAEQSESLVDDLACIVVHLYSHLQVGLSTQAGQHQQEHFESCIRRLLLMLPPGHYAHVKEQILQTLIQ